jgi:hypothetical protein
MGLLRFIFIPSPTIHIKYLLYEEKKDKENGKEGAATAGGCV